MRCVLVITDEGGLIDIYARFEPCLVGEQTAVELAAVEAYRAVSEMVQPGSSDKIDNKVFRRKLCGN